MELSGCDQVDEVFHYSLQIKLLYNLPAVAVIVGCYWYPV